MDIPPGIRIMISFRLFRLAKIALIANWREITIAANSGLAIDACSGRTSRLDVRPYGGECPQSLLFLLRQQ